MNIAAFMVLVLLVQQPLIASVPSFLQPEKETTTTIIVINLDGDLKSAISPELRDITWKGKYPLQMDWFTGEIGQSQLNLDYNFSDTANPFAESNIHFINVSGNRPFPFMSTLNGALPKFYLRQIHNITVHF